MSRAKELHNQAMDAAQFALWERVRGNHDEAATFFGQALKDELAAIAELEKTGPVNELTYAILHRSAGTLALDCKEFRLAEELATKVLAQEPHPEIAWELRELLEQIYFQWGLGQQGVELSDDEIQLSLMGREVGFGLVNAEELLGRVHNSSQLLYRIAERRANRSFREGGYPAREIREGYQTFISAVKSGSFIATLKLGQPAGQLSLPGMAATAEVVDEFIDLMQLVTRSRIEEIKERVPDLAYRRNFFALAKKLAPDGRRIQQVSFKAGRGGVARSVEITKPAADFPAPPVEEAAPGESEAVELRGILRYANATRSQQNQIRIMDSDRKSHTIEVPAGMMNDIVRPMWDTPVVVEGLKQAGRIVLQDIWPAAEEAEEEGEVYL